MKILIVVASKHRQNTLKIAEAMSEAAPVTVAELCDADRYNFKEYDIIGFGSGIYAGKFDKKLLNIIKQKSGEIKRAFVFSTSGTGNYVKYNAKAIALLKERNIDVLGDFGCKGLCKWFIFGLVGGIAKDHPDAEDYEAAQSFIENIARAQ